MTLDVVLGILAGAVLIALSITAARLWERFAHARWAARPREERMDRHTPGPDLGLGGGDSGWSGPASH